MIEKKDMAHANWQDIASTIMSVAHRTEKESLYCELIVPKEFTSLAVRLVRDLDVEDHFSISD